MNKPARRRSSYKILEDQQQQQPQPQPQQQQPTWSSATNASSASANKNNNNSNSNIMDGAYRRIELQSPEDLTFLINNVRRAAAEHIGAAFPPVDGQDEAEEDELRVRIEKLVDQYIARTFTLAAPNLSINGFDLDASTFSAVYLSSSSSPNSTRTRHQAQQDKGKDEIQIQYEPFDARKRSRVEELAREEEDLMREIAALKRKVPLAAARAYHDGFWEGVRADQESLERARAQAVLLGVGKDDDDDDGKKDGEGDDGVEGEAHDGARKDRKKKAMLDGIGPLERQEGVERGYEAVVETLGRLKRDMPATVAKMERARVAGEYVVTEG